MRSILLLISTSFFCACLIAQTDGCEYTGTPIIVGTSCNQYTFNITNDSDYWNAASGCNAQDYDDAWWWFTAVGTTTTIEYTASTLATIHVFTGTCSSNMAAIACAGDNIGGNTEIISIPTNIGENYAVRIQRKFSNDDMYGTICVYSPAGTVNCNINSSLIESSSSDPSTPIGGPYSYGEVVSFCYTITDWQIIGDNWLHGIVPSFGNGWAPSSFDVNGMPASISTPLTTAGSITSGAGGNYTACIGEPAGTWVWHSAGEITYNNLLADLGTSGSLPDGAPIEGGWFFETNYNTQLGDCSDQTDPNLTFGDNNWYPGISNLDWNLCFELTVGPPSNCATGQTDLSLSIKSYADGETGLFSSLECVNDLAQTFNASLDCCPVISNPGSQSSCNTFTLPSIIGENLTGNEAYYTGPGGTGIQYNVGDILNWGDFVSYPTTLYISDPTSCGVETSFDLTIEVAPTLTMIAPNTLCVNDGVQLGMNGCSISGGIYSGPGVTDNGNGLTYDFDPSVAGIGMHPITYTLPSEPPGCAASDTDLVEVMPLPTITFNNQPNYCIDAGVQTGISGATPLGGVYSGPGVTDEGNGYSYTFDPAAAGVGSHTITYSYTDLNGCTNTSSIDALVSELPSSSTIVESACESFTLNGTTYTSSGTYSQLLTSQTGCDSTLILDLTVNYNSNSVIHPIACNGYISPSGNVYDNSGTYNEVIINSVGCDSSITINLTIVPNDTTYLTESECSSYIAPDNQVYNTSGQYTATLTNTEGCDSIIVINLSINDNASAILASSCEYYVAPDGNTYTTSGIYTATLTNSEGCDSSITIDLLIDEPVFDTLNISAVDSYTLNGFTYNASGTYEQIISTQNMCDTTITLNLVIYSSGLQEAYSRDISIFPNPSNSIIYFSGLLNNTQYSIELTNNLGEVINKRKFIPENSKPSLDVSKLKPGVYFVKVFWQSELFRIIKLVITN